MKLIDLKQQRHQNIEAAQAILDKALRESRNVTTDERTAISDYHEKVRNFNSSIELIETQEGIVSDINEPGRSRRDSGASSPEPLMPGELRALSPNEKLADVISVPQHHRDLDPAKYLRGIVTGKWDGAQEERSVMSEGTLGNGGYVVPGTFASSWIDLARSQTFSKAAGTKLIPMSSNTLRYPRQLTDPATSWKAENAAMGANGLTFDAVQFTSKTLMAIVAMSVELFEDSAPQAAEVVVNALTKKFAVEMDRVALLGSSANGEPTGIVNVSGVNALDSGANGAALSSYDQMQDALSLIAQNNGNPDQCSAVMSPRSFYEFGKLKNTLTDSLRIPSTLADLPRYQSSIIPNNLTVGSSTDCSQIVVGDFNQTAFGVRTDLVIESTRVGSDGSGNNAFSQLQVLIRAYLRCDFQVFRPNWFTVISGVR